MFFNAVLESLFNQVAGLKAKFLGTVFFGEHLRWLLLNIKHRQD